MKKYKVEISFRDGVKDIQAEAILKMANSNKDLGDGKIRSLKMGKWFLLECENDLEIEKLCSKLLANSVIEDYKIFEENLRDHRDPYEEHVASQGRFDF